MLPLFTPFVHGVTSVLGEFLVAEVAVVIEVLLLAAKAGVSGLAKDASSSPDEDADLCESDYWLYSPDPAYAAASRLQ